MVADCVPIVVAGSFDDGTPALAAVHAGRPGLVAGVVPSAVSRLRDAGARDLEAWIGPSICGACYEVPEAMRSEVDAVVPGTAAETRWGTAALDLPAGVVRQLREAEVSVHTEAWACTYEHDELFSHRRAPGVGRFAGLVWTHG
jgi:copper oxidase (laccase) domain-containing protein